MAKTTKMKRRAYDRALARLQVELCEMQTWIRESGARIVVIFEGRDAAGKGGVIKRITERVSPRVFRVVALPAPNDRERSQFYLQRYITHLPAAGEIVLFDRSWYNRAGVERVMGYCTKGEYEHFMRVCPDFERNLVGEGIQLIKYFFDVSRDEQEKRFLARINDPLRQWKLSEIDLESYRRWWDYAAAIDDMFEATDTEYAPWWVVHADDKRKARLDCIAHLLSVVPYEPIKFDKPSLPKRLPKPKRMREARLYKNIVPEAY